MSMLTLCLTLIAFALSRTIVTIAYLLVWWGVFRRKPQHIDKVNRLGEIICGNRQLPFSEGISRIVQRKAPRQTSNDD